MNNFNSVLESYKPRFLKTPAQAVEIVDYYHLARVAGKNTRYERMIWAAAEFHKLHPDVSATAAYKDLDGLIGG